MPLAGAKIDDGCPTLAIATSQQVPGAVHARVEHARVLVNLHGDLIADRERRRALLERADVLDDAVLLPGDHRVDREDDVPVHQPSRVRGLPAAGGYATVLSQNDGVPGRRAVRGVAVRLHRAHRRRALEPERVVEVQELGGLGHHSFRPDRTRPTASRRAREGKATSRREGGKTRRSERRGSDTDTDAPPGSAAREERTEEARRETRDHWYNAFSCSHRHAAGARPRSRSASTVHRSPSK